MGKQIFRLGRGDNTVECRVDCYQCERITSSGRQCRRRTCMWGSVFCHTHHASATEYAVTVGKSTIPAAGKGLFAKVPFKYGDIVFNTTVEFPRGTVAEYKGDLRPKDTIVSRRGQDRQRTEFVVKNMYGKVIEAAMFHNLFPGNTTHPDAMLIENDTALNDPMCKRSLWRYANHHPTDFNASVFLLTRDQMMITAEAPIAKGEEIFISYGDEYNMDDVTPMKLSTRAENRDPKTSNYTRPRTKK